MSYGVKLGVKVMIVVGLMLWTWPIFAQKPTTKPLIAIPIAKVWSGHSVGFDVVTTEKFQYVTYYDEDRNMVIAQRAMTSKEWKKTVLPSNFMVNRMCGG